MRTRSLIGLALVFMLVAAGSAAAGGEAAADTGPGHDYVIVTLSSPPAASYAGGIDGIPATKPARGKLDTSSSAYVAYQVYLAKERRAFLDELARKAPKAEVVRTYSVVLNGFALKLNGEAVAAIERISGVSAVGYSQLYKPTMTVSNTLIGADDVWQFDEEGVNVSGAGIKVGVIDTGIDDGHPFFGCKQDLVPDDAEHKMVHKVFFSGEGTSLFGDDIVFSHGTHVAGTIAGCEFDGATAQPVAVAGTLSGVAPGADLYDYNVFPGYGAGFIAFGGSAFSHDIAAALEEAVKDGMDVVNMSLGGGASGPKDFLAEAANATVDAGVVVVASAGNSGPGDSTVGSPAAAEKVIAVAASTNGHFAGVPVDVGDTTYVAASGDFGPYGDPTGPSDLVWWQNATTDDDTLACDAADTPSVIDGNIALISRGACTFTTKIRNAEAAGAVGVIVYNNVDGPPIGMAHDGTDPKPGIVAVMVSKADGEAIIEGGFGATTIGGGAVEFFADPEEVNVIAGFSSRGPAPFTGIIKPDITAPGVNIYSSVLDGKFAFFQGTSMSAPHITGSVALLLAANPGWSPAEVKSALVNTARRDTINPSGSYELLAWGGGIVWLPDALAAPATLDPSNASFGIWEGNKYVRDSIEITISNGTCTATGVTQSEGPVTNIVSIEQDGNVVTVTLDAGRAADTPSGDYAGDIVFDCGNDGSADLLAPWFVRIDREAVPGQP